MTAWHEDDAFWEAFGPLMFTEELRAAAPADIDAILALVDLPSGASVLDLGCGVGRHALELARRGYEVTGVDRTAAYLAEARERARKEGLPVAFLTADMREFVRPAAFDMVLSLCTSFSYFEDAADNRKVLSNVARSLKPQGRFVLQLKGKEVLARIFQARDWREQNGTYFLQERTLSDNWGWMQNRWILIQDGSVQEFNVSHWIYSAAELVSLLTSSGFAHVDIYGDLEGAPYDQTARQLVAVARI
jgi:cyclopropane fatty-acyl-phospholipid synthase-like methyltransferase